MEGDQSTAFVVHDTLYLYKENNITNRKKTKHTVEGNVSGSIHESVALKTTQV